MLLLRSIEWLTSYRGDFHIFGFQVMRARPPWSRRRVFIELVPHEEDRYRLRNIIKKSDATSTSAEYLHVHMRDAGGSSVLVQLFIRRSLYSHRACFLSFLPAVVLWESTAAVGRSMATASTTSPLILSPARLLTRNWADEPLIR